VLAPHSAPATTATPTAAATRFLYTNDATIDILSIKSTNRVSGIAMVFELNECETHL
jgi:hypothetical protein